MAEEKKSLVDEAYEQIRQKICDFELVPGQPISDFILSKSLGMSRTPIRMALQKLELDRLVEPGGQGQSYVVSGLSAEDIADLFDARCGLELTSLYLVIQKGISPQELENLHRINQRMEEVNQKGYIKQQFQYDQMFHDRIVQLSQNSRINRFNDSLRPQFIRMRVLSYLEHSYQAKAYREHEQVVNMIEQGNSEEAIHILHDHIVSTKTNYINLLNDRLNTESMALLSYAMKHDARGESPKKGE